jgi:transposase
LEGIDKKIKAIKKELTALVEARDCSLMTLTGIGPSSAARLLADVGDIHRFAATSSRRERHRPSRRLLR